MLGLPLLLTRDWSGISFMKTGPIGDTIGGITAPISGLLGAYLVFLALKAQVKANEIIQDQIRVQKSDELLMEIYKHLKERIDDFNYEIKYRRKINGKEVESRIIQHRGSTGIVKFLEDKTSLSRRGKPFIQASPELSTILSVLYILNQLLNKIKAYKNQKYDTELIVLLVSFLYSHQIWDNIEETSIDILQSPGKTDSYLVGIHKEMKDINERLEKLRTASS